MRRISEHWLPYQAEDCIHSSRKVIDPKKREEQNGKAERAIDEDVQTPPQPDVPSHPMPSIPKPQPKDGNNCPLSQHAK